MQQWLHLEVNPSMVKIGNLKKKYFVRHEHDCTLVLDLQVWWGVTPCVCFVIREAWTFIRVQCQSWSVHWLSPVNYLSLSTNFSCSLPISPNSSLDLSGRIVVVHSTGTMALSAIPSFLCRCSDYKASSTLATACFSYAAEEIIFKWSRSPHPHWIDLCCWADFRLWRSLVHQLWCMFNLFSDRKEIFAPPYSSVSVPRRDERQLTKQLKSEALSAISSSFVSVLNLKFLPVVWLIASASK